jgi:hypothetical protein
VVISASRAALSRALVMWTCGGGTNQSWSVAPYGTIRVYGKCMDVSGAGASNGTLVDLYDCNGGTDQELAVP